MEVEVCGLVLCLATVAQRERTSVSEETVIRDDQLLADLALILQREERGSSLRNKNVL